MEVIKKKLVDLIPASYNPRKDLQEADQEYQALKKSIQRFGLVVPIIENKQTGNIVGGHQRLIVLKNLGWKDVDVVVIDVDEIKEKAINLAMNRLKGDWDNKALTNVLTELKDNGINLLELGFTNAELVSMFPKHMDAQTLFGGEEENPFAVEEEVEDETTIVAMVGKYRFSLEKSKAEEVVGDIRYRNGFVKEKVENEIKLRLLHGKDWKDYVTEEV